MKCTRNTNELREPVDLVDVNTIPGMEFLRHTIPGIPGEETWESGKSDTRAGDNVPSTWTDEGAADSPSTRLKNFSMK
jgi:hypothetical protein